MRIAIIVSGKIGATAASDLLHESR